MQPFLKENKAKLDAIKQPLPVELRIPFNAGRVTGVKGVKQPVIGSFSNGVPNNDSIKLTPWLNYKAQRGDLTSFVTTTGNHSLAGNVTLAENLAFTETVTTPATSSTLTLVQKQLVHTVVGGGGTEEIEINVPDGSLLFSAEILVSEDLEFTTGTAVTATWTNSTQQIGGTDALAAQNDKVTSFYDANATSAIATGTPETITLTADAGTLDAGELVVVVRYWTLSGLADVA